MDFDPGHAVAAGLHVIVSLAWLVVLQVSRTRAAFFGAGGIVLTHVATGALALSYRARTHFEFLTWFALVTDILGLGALAGYAYDLVRYRLYGSECCIDPEEKTMAHLTWHVSPEATSTAIVVCLLLAFTAAVHLVTIGTFAVLWCRWQRRKPAL